MKLYSSIFYFKYILLNIAVSTQEILKLLKREYLNSFSNRQMDLWKIFSQALKPSQLRIIADNLAFDKIEQVKVKLLRKPKTPLTCCFIPVHMKPKLEAYVRIFGLSVDRTFQSSRGRIWRQLGTSFQENVVTWK